jgi:hypothetical protein
VGVKARRTRQLLPFASMVTSPAVIFMVTVPVALRPTMLMVVVPMTSRPAPVVACVMPFAVTPMTLFPLPMFPITMPVIVPVAIPARTDENRGRRLDIHLRGRSVDRLRSVDNAGDSDVHPNIDVREGDGRYADAEAGNQCHREPAVAEDSHNLIVQICVIGQRGMRASYWLRLIAVVLVVMPMVMVAAFGYKDAAAQRASKTNGQ